MTRFTTLLKRPAGPRAHPSAEQCRRLEGGISNGEDIVVRGYLKPISTLRKPLESVRFDTRETTKRQLRAQRYLRGPGGRRGRRGDGGADHCAAGPGKIRRRFCAGIATKFDGYIEQIRRF